MKRSLILFCVILVSSMIYSQGDSKYMKGTVPEVDGKVVFSKTITTNDNISGEKLFDLLDKWAKENFKGGDNGIRNRVAISDPITKDIVCLGDKLLIFKRTFAVQDETNMLYQLFLKPSDNKCDITVKNITYKIFGSNNEYISAEEMINDRSVFGKNGDKVSGNAMKFRTHTIDSINAIYASIDTYLNGTKATKAIPGAVTTQVEVAPQLPIVDVQQKEAILPGYKRVDADKIPGNIIKLLGDWTLITSGTAENTNVMTASWGGLGVFWEKPVSFCFINPTRHSITTMDKGDTYTISFYTEAYKEALLYCGSHTGRDTDKIKGSGLTPIKLPSGATAFSEAWMILECKKIVAQPISPDAVVVKDLPNDWTKDGYHKMYIGEILNVWIK